MEATLEGLLYGTGGALVLTVGLAVQAASTRAASELQQLSACIFRCIDFVKENINTCCIK